LSLQSAGQRHAKFSQSSRTDFEERHRICPSLRRGPGRAWRSAIPLSAELPMDMSEDERNDRQSKVSAEAQWASNFAWGLSAAAAILAILLWALFGK
jgi:hypothetical protein